jgi:DNA recombination protein RmuC
MAFAFWVVLIETGIVMFVLYFLYRREQEREVLIEELAEAENAREELEKQVMQCGKIVKEWKLQLEEVKKEKEELKHKVEQKERELEKMTEKLEEFRKKLGEERGRRELLQQKLREEQWKLEELKKQLNQCDLVKEERIEVGIAKIQLENVEEFTKKMGEVEQKLEEIYNAVNIWDRKPGVKEGGWGVVTLERLLELTGLGSRIVKPQWKYRESGEELGREPAFILDLPSGLKVAIDVKEPTELYSQLGKRKPDLGEEDIKLFIHNLKKQIEELGELNQQQERQLIGTFLFIPVEEAYLLAVDRGVWEFGFKRRVYLASPTTLLPILKLVYQLWKWNTLLSKGGELHTFLEQVEDQIKGITEEDLDQLRISLNYLNQRYRKLSEHLHQLRWEMEQFSSPNPTPQTQFPA